MKSANKDGTNCQEYFWSFVRVALQFRFPSCKSNPKRHLILNIFEVLKCIFLSSPRNILLSNQHHGFTIKMNRLLQPFIMECYLPCVAIVIVSKISFLIPLDSVPGRVALLVTQFLTLTNICIHQQVFYGLHHTSIIIYISLQIMWKSQILIIFCFRLKVPQPGNLLRWEYTFWFACFS